MSKKLEKYLQCCWYSEASIHCITAPDPLLPKTFRQRQSNVSPELMRKLERSMLQDPVSSFFLRIESLILLILLCIRIADCPAMCVVVCSLPQIPVCVIWQVVGQWDRCNQGPPPSTWLTIWLLLPRDSPCSSMTSGRSAREGEEASQLAVANPGLLGPNRTTCGLHSPPPGPAPANPAPQNFPALLPHLCPR